MKKIIYGENLEVLKSVADGCAHLVYIDPPFNTGKKQERSRIKTVHDEQGGDRTGFQGKRYRTIKLGTSGYDDVFDDYLGFLEPRLREAWRLLDKTGSFFLHVDYREVLERSPGRRPARGVPAAPGVLAEARVEATPTTHGLHHRDAAEVVESRLPFPRWVASVSPR